MRISVVVPVYNRGELVRACLQRVTAAIAELGLAAEVTVVDDGSSDGSLEIVQTEFPAVQLLCNDHNLGFAVSANRGLRAARGDYLFLLNSDTEVSAGDLEQLLDFLELNSAYAGAAPRMVDGEGVTRQSCMAFPTLKTALFFATPLAAWCPHSAELKRYFQRDADPSLDADVLQPPAAAWLIRRSAWEEVGDFDETLELFFNDVDWCRRLQASGGKLRYLAGTAVLHHEGASTAERPDFVTRWQTDRWRYYRKHFGPLGALWVKLCVSWTFSDWCLRNTCRRMLGRAAEPLGPTARAFVSFLRSGRPPGLSSSPSAQS